MVINSDARILLGEEIAGKIEDIRDERLHVEERRRILLTLLDEWTVSDDEYGELADLLNEQTEQLEMTA